VGRMQGPRAPAKGRLSWTFQRAAAYHNTNTIYKNFVSSAEAGRTNHVPRTMHILCTFLGPENAPKSLAAGDLPQTALGKLTVIPVTPTTDRFKAAILLRVLLLRGGERKRKERWR